MDGWWAAPLVSLKSCAAAACKWCSDVTELRILHSSMFGSVSTAAELSGTPSHWLLLSYCGASFACGVMATVSTQVATAALMRRWSLWKLRRMSLPHELLAPIGIPSDLVLRRLGYSVAYSYSLRSPVWATYAINREMVRHAQRTTRAAAFATDRDVPRRYRASLASLRQHKEFDRGHLAPQASVGYCRDSSDESFLTSNVILQHQRVNRVVWKRLETSLRKLVAHSSRTIAVCVGPVFSRKTLSATVSKRRRRDKSLLNDAADTTDSNGRKTSNDSPSSDVATAAVVVPESVFLAYFDTTNGKSGAYLVRNNASAQCRSMTVAQLETYLDVELHGGTDAALRGEQQQTEVPPSQQWFSRLRSFRRLVAWLRQRLFGRRPHLRQVVLFHKYRRNTNGACDAASNRASSPWRAVVDENCTSFSLLHHHHHHHRQEKQARIRAGK